MSFFTLIEQICYNLLLYAACLSMTYAHMLHLNEGGVWDLWVESYMQYLSIVDQRLLYDHKGFAFSMGTYILCLLLRKPGGVTTQYAYPNFYTFPLSFRIIGHST